MKRLLSASLSFSLVLALAVPGSMFATDNPEKAVSYTHLPPSRCGANTATSSR